MINQMDQIYSNASLTIIDASGGDAQSGLPGVNRFARRLQQSVHIRNTTLLELPCGEHELKSSKWVTRGWTYQECYFSKMRLVFTKSQVLFLSNQTYAEESVHRLFHRLRDPTYTVTSPRIFKNLIPEQSSDELDFLTQHLLGQLEEYSKRELTYPTDSLNAFLGVLNSTSTDKSFEGQRYLRFQHISWGLFVRKQKNGSRKLSGKDCLRVYLDWYHVTPAARRPEFPSWTWAGWGGPLKMEYEGITLPKYGNDPRPFAHLDWDISCEPGGLRAVNIWELASILSNATYTDEVRRFQQRFSKRLQITCPVVPVRLQQTPLKGALRGKGTDVHFENETYHMLFKHMDLTNENVAVVQFCKGIYLAAVPYVDEVIDTQDRLIGLLFAREDHTWGMSFGCLLARQLGEGIYERVGAIPHLMAYPRHGATFFSIALPQLIFLDKAGSVLDKVRLPARQRELPFDGVGEKRTIFLV